MSTHLFVRSCYSLLDSTVRIPKLVEKAKQLGYTYTALTDHNVMFGMAAFSYACRKAGIRPVCGMEADVSCHDRTVPFLLLAKDNKGYQNLMKLSSLICERNGPCSIEELKACTHCFLIAYGENGWADSELINENREGIIEKLRIMKEELGEFDIALSFQESSLWMSRNKMLKSICRMLGIKTCALNKVLYLEADEAEDYRMVCGIRQNKTVQDQSLPLLKGRYFLSAEEMEKLYDADDLQRTDEIASQCRCDMETGKTSLPVFDVPGSLTSAQYLTQLCLAGLSKRLGGRDDPGYRSRLKYELDTIIRMHFEDYFLIVYDFIRAARKMDIYVGPGRGSAAGSLVAYCLGITQIDPLKYNLLFERFLNPERVSMPDIDTDIPDNRRQDVINYVYEKYGADHIANIVTFGTLGARQVIRDTAKVTCLPQRDTDMLCRMIPNTPKITLAEALNRSTRLREVVNAENRYRSLFRTASRLEGLPRHCSVHAAGIIMSRLPLNDVIPTIQLDEGMKTSQYTMEYLEERGLIKMDFLGLRNLTTIDKIVSMIRKTQPEFDIMKIPMNDHKTIDVFARVDTVGIFQFESAGMKGLLRKMHVSCFDDIVAALALFRPASMQNIPLYLENRQHRDQIVYPAEELEDILKETYGVMIYQEQAMLTAQKAAGFSLGKADVLRKAMSKKKESEMLALRDEFIKGCLKNGYSNETAVRLFDTIEKFAGYGFNKSHAVAYGLIAYQMAYLKANAPLYFYSALIDSVTGDKEKTSQYIDECRRRGIDVAGPDISRSGVQCVIDGQTIILPLSEVRDIGMHASEALIEERNRKPYDDFFDFVARCGIIKIGRKSIETMIDAGALDCFRMNRATMKGGLDDALNYAELVRIDNNGVSLINLDLVSKPVLVRRTQSAETTNENERNALGFTLGPHPIIAVRNRLGIHLPSIASLKDKKGYVDGFAQITSVKQHRTKKGDMMAFVKVCDETSELEMSVMPRLYSQKEQDLAKNEYIRFHAKIDSDGSCIAESITAVRQSLNTAGG